VSFFDALPQRYRVILCDLWGVVHDGLALYPGAAERLIEWRGDGRFVLLITNAPRTAEAIAAHVTRLGLPKEGWDAIATAGEAGIEALNRLDAPVGFIGTGGDRAVLEGKGVRIADGDDFTDLACTGLEEHRPEVAQYRAELERLSARGVRLHCLNPDRVVIQGGVPALIPLRTNTPSKPMRAAPSMSVSSPSPTASTCSRGGFPASLSACS
jgi:ribonucleotide monophosphatase NagD (HAD superfamily)